MANHKSALKRNRQSLVRRERNRSNKTRIKTALKKIDEAIAQGRASASRAITLLAKETINTSGTVAETEPAICSSCGVCVSICPYSAPFFTETGPNAGKAEVNPVLCKGCGLCVASCRSGAIHLKGFDNNQIFAQLFSLSEEVG